MRMICRDLGDLPPGTVTTDSSGMETVNVYGSPQINWAAILILAAVLYVVLTPSDTKEKHARVAGNLVRSARRKITENFT